MRQIYHTWTNRQVFPNNRVKSCHATRLLNFDAVKTCAATEEPLPFGLCAACSYRRPHCQILIGNSFDMHVLKCQDTGGQDFHSIFLWIKIGLYICTFVRDLAAKCIIQFCDTIFFNPNPTSDQFFICYFFKSCYKN